MAYSLSCQHADLEVLIFKWSMETHALIILWESSPQHSRLSLRRHTPLPESNAIRLEFSDEEDQRKEDPSDGNGCFKAIEKSIYSSRLCYFDEGEGIQLDCVLEAFLSY